MKRAGRVAQGEGLEFRPQYHKKKKKERKKGGRIAELENFCFDHVPPLPLLTTQPLTPFEFGVLSH
jgi:hypothetical protein